MIVFFFKILVIKAAEKIFDLSEKKRSIFLNFDNKKAKIAK